VEYTCIHVTPKHFNPVSLPFWFLRHFYIFFASYFSKRAKKQNLLISNFLFCFYSCTQILTDCPSLNQLRVGGGIASDLHSSVTLSPTTAVTLRSLLAIVGGMLTVTSYCFSTVPAGDVAVHVNVPSSDNFNEIVQ